MKKIIIFLILGATLWYFRSDIVWQINKIRRDRNLPPAITAENIILQPDVLLVQPQIVPEQTTSTKKEIVVIPPPPPSIVKKDVPDSFNLAVPFTSQAPYANWELPYQESCEEASVLMAYWFLNNVSEVSRDEANTQILEVVDWESARFGYFEDTNVEETLIILKDKFGLSGAYIEENPSVEDIKKAVAQGFPVIVPVAGKLLKNPYFSGDGPLYHMLVVRGYTKTNFITNDPGTKRGEAYQYEQEHLMSVIHDWNGGDVERGRQAVIVVKR